MQYVYVKTVPGIFGRPEYYDISAKNDEEAKMKALRLHGEGGTLYALRVVY